MESDGIRPNHFDRSKAFYPIVMCYFHQLFGLRELAIQGIAGPEPLDAKVARLAPASTKEKVSELKKGIQKLCGPLELRSEQHDQHIEIDVGLISIETSKNFSYLASYTLLAAGQLFIVSFELLKEVGKYEVSPNLEFLRHCRNAAAHGGKFHILNNEPRHTAEWGKFKITRDLHGTPLFRRPDGKGMLGPGDPVRLLWDIERSYPNIVPCKRIYQYLIE